MIVSLFVSCTKEKPYWYTLSVPSEYELTETSTATGTYKVENNGLTPLSLQDYIKVVKENQEFSLTDAIDSMTNSWRPGRRVVFSENNKADLYGFNLFGQEYDLTELYYRFWGFNTVTVHYDRPDERKIPLSMSLKSNDRLSVTLEMYEYLCTDQMARSPLTKEQLNIEGNGSLLISAEYLVKNKRLINGDYIAVIRNEYTYMRK